MDIRQWWSRGQGRGNAGQAGNTAASVPCVCRLGPEACVGHRLNRNWRLDEDTAVDHPDWVGRLGFLIFKEEMESFFKGWLRINWLIQTVNCIIVIP